MNLLDSGFNSKSLCLQFGLSQTTGIFASIPFSCIIFVVCSSGHTKTNSFARGLTSDALTTIPETLVIVPMVSALICRKLLSRGKFAILTRTSSLIFSA